MFFILEWLLMKNGELVKKIEERLMNVYDPEFSIIDVFTLGLIYQVSVDQVKNQIHVLMTFTTPACPMADLIQEMVKNAILDVVPNFVVEIEITFDPMWSLDKIKDQDVKRMFE